MKAQPCDFSNHLHCLESSETKQSGLNQFGKEKKKKKTSVNLVIIKITRPAWACQFKIVQNPIM